MFNKCLTTRFAYGIVFIDAKLNRINRNRKQQKLTDKEMLNMFKFISNLFNKIKDRKDKKKKRLDILTSLRKFVESGKNIRYYYFDKDGNGEDCYCAVGYIMNECGINKEDLLGNNQKCISSLGSEIEIRLREGSMLTNDEINMIQVYNDQCHKKGLIKYIDKLIGDTV